jgi:3-oxoacid CoA-transferase subunit A
MNNRMAGQMSKISVAQRLNACSASSFSTETKTQDHVLQGPIE